MNYAPDLLVLLCRASAAVERAHTEALRVLDTHETRQNREAANKAIPLLEQLPAKLERADLSGASRLFEEIAQCVARYPGPYRTHAGAMRGWSLALRAPMPALALIRQEMSESEPVDLPPFLRNRRPTC